VSAFRTVFGALILPLALVPSVATAQAHGGSGSGSSGGSASPGTPRILDRIARNHFETGNEYFQVSRYEDAAREFQLAYEITHQAELLFNIGRALEAAGNIQGALDAYQRYDDAGAPGFDRDVLHERMENLRARMTASAASGTGTSGTSGTGTEQGASGTGAAGAAGATGAGVGAGAGAAGSATTGAAASGAAGTSAPRVRVVYRQSGINTVGPFVTMGVGVGLGAASLVFGLLAANGVGLVDHANQGTQAWDRNVNDAYTALPTQIALSWGLGIAGGAVFAGGLIWLAARGRGERHEVPVAFVAPTEGGAVFGLRGAL
jgi:hypothetical protein